ADQVRRRRLLRRRRPAERQPLVRQRQDPDRREPEGLRHRLRPHQPWPGQLVRPAQPQPELRRAGGDDRQLLDVLPHHRGRPPPSTPSDARACSATPSWRWAPTPSRPAAGPRTTTSTRLAATTASIAITRTATRWSSSPTPTRPAGTTPSTPRPPCCSSRTAGGSWTTCA